MAILFCGSWPAGSSFFLFFCIFFLSTSTWGSTRIVGGESHRWAVGEWRRRLTYPAKYILPTICHDFTVQLSRSTWLTFEVEAAAGESPDPFQANVEIRLKVHRRTFGIHGGCLTKFRLRVRIRMTSPVNASPSIFAAALTFEPLRNHKVHWSHRSSCRILFVRTSPGSRPEKGKLRLLGNFAMLAHFLSAFQLATCLQASARNVERSSKTRGI